MVSQVDRGGLRDWLIQRITALFVGIYALFLIFYYAAHQPMTYGVWYNLFNHLSMKIITLIVLLCVLWHAWIGLWTVFTDYVKNRFVRLILEIIVGLLLLIYLGWLFETLWVVL